MTDQNIKPLKVKYTQPPTLPFKVFEFESHQPQQTSWRLDLIAFLIDQRTRRNAVTAIVMYPGEYPTMTLSLTTEQSGRLPFALWWLMSTDGMTGFPQ